ncbi:MAG TPA: phospho-sugar mutase [Micromonosporaceae bacterium]|jgi:phosphomannomutase|nr:phospho-sugar mutase [Micromonosporaceae bacterium]
MPAGQPTTSNEDVRARADAWLADDPDPATRDELRTVLASGPAGDAELRDRFAGTLQFGTAGLRGPLRAGPNGMNRAVVRAAAAGLIGWLTGRDEGGVVIGYDARTGSAEFADETARVVTGAGREALVLPQPLPTPVLAYAVRHLGAAAGVMVTASHNPPQDNGYKVYLGPRLGGPTGGGAQIVPPVDAEIEAAIRAVGPLAAVPLGPAGQRLGADIAASYVRAAAAIVDPAAPRELTVAYTPLHGVGGDIVLAAFAAAGFATPSVVGLQAQPDPRFPTVGFPNPEEPGAIDLVVALARELDADIAIANDPDADRCAVAVPTGEARNGWRMLRGDDVGVLLADHLMRRGQAGRYATTIVSSSLLGAMCAKRGHPYAETLTGFKWIMRAGEDEIPLGYGYEEALGYSVAPDLVRDKDGITAALRIAELAAGLKTRSRTLLDRLDEIAAEFGVYATDQVSVRVDDLGEIDLLMRRVRRNPPAVLLDAPVRDVVDLMPENDVLTVRTDAARIVVRPSGTEPKLKAYLQIVEPVRHGDVPAARTRAAAALAALRTETAAMLGV